MGASQVSKSNEQDRSQRAAARLAYLRTEKFVTEGFKSNEPTPTLSAARSMHSANLRAYRSLKPMPSVSSQ